MQVRLCPGRGPRGEHLPGVARVPGARLRHLLLLHVCKQQCLLRVVDTRAVCSTGAGYSRCGCGAATPWCGTSPT